MTSSTHNPLLELARRQHRGEAVGLGSVCSAHRLVLEAAMIQAATAAEPVLIESTSNQVDQFGGYTGMNPQQFVKLVADAATVTNLPRDRIMAGGDHLGPNRWREQPAAAAMEQAATLVRACVLAGYDKIHLDASMHCADDAGARTEPLPDETVANRAAQLCTVAEEAHAERGGRAPVYVIGTEVPAPGGAVEELDRIDVTDPAAAEATLAATRHAFRKRGLDAAWERVFALVVQPGVEFGDAQVAPYDRPRAQALKEFIETQPELVYEAHSTDYQTPAALRRMVEDHFAILKVGPWLTFALREAVFALAAMETEWLSGHRDVTLSGVVETLDQAMLDDPKHWQRHYHGDPAALRYARKFSYSDRSRYYWPDVGVEEALRRLIANLRTAPPPLTLVSQFMPEQYWAVRNSGLDLDPESLIRHKIMEVTGIYADAGRGAPETPGPAGPEPCRSRKS